MSSRGSRSFSNLGILLLGLVLVVALGLVLWRRAAESERAQPPAAGFAPEAPREVGAETAPVARADEPAQEESAEGAVEAEAEEERVAAPEEVAPSPEVVPGVRGRVLDRDEEPVADALVLLAPEAGTAPWPLDARGPPGGFEPLRTRTDAKGRFLVDGAPLGSLRLGVRKSGLAPLDVEELTVWPAEVLDLGDLTMLPGAIVSGVVVDLRNAPLEGARLFSLGALLPGRADTLSADNGALAATTDVLGSFRIDTLRPGRWRLLVAAEGHPEQVFEGRVDPLDGPLDGLVFELGEGASITGRVVAGESELPLVVHALPQRFVDFQRKRETLAGVPELLAGYRSAEVDRFGDFEVRGLVPREPYLLRVRKRGQPLSTGDPFSESGSVQGTGGTLSSPVRVRAGARDVELPYGESAALEFQAVDGATGVPIERVDVSVSGAWPAKMIDGAGNERDRFPGGLVVMEGLRPFALARDRAFADILVSADCLVSVASPGYKPVLVKKVRFTSGRRTGLGQVRLTPLPVLRLRVVDDEAGAPIGRAQVSVVGKHHRSEGQTDGHGRVDVSFPLEPVGFVSVSAEGHRPFAAELPVGVCSRPEPREVRLERSRAGDVGWVEVLARDYTGDPLSSFGVLRAVVPRPEIGGVELFSLDGAGRALLSHAFEEPYDYALQARPRLGSLPELEPLWQRATARLGEVTTLVFFDNALERLHGTILFNGRPLGDASLRAMPGEDSLDRLTEEWEHGSSLSALGYADSAAARHGFAGGRTDAEGHFAFEDVAPGVYSILIDHAATGIRTRRVVRAGPSELVLDVGDTEISGTVADSAGVPLEGVPVYFVVADRYPMIYYRLPRSMPLASFGRGLEPFATAYTDFRGRYRVDAVPPDLTVGIVVRAGDLVGSRWGVRAKRAYRVDDQDVVVAPVASLDVFVGREQGRGRHAVILFNREWPGSLGTVAARVDEDGVARFGDLDPGPWSAVAFSVDEFDRAVEPIQRKEVELAPGEHHELTLE